MEKIKRSEPVSSVSSVSTQSVPIGRERFSERAFSYQTTSWLERAKQYLADLGNQYDSLTVRIGKYNTKDVSDLYYSARNGSVLFVSEDFLHAMGKSQASFERGIQILTGAVQELTTPSSPNVSGMGVLLTDKEKTSFTVQTPTVSQWEQTQQENMKTLFERMREAQEKAEKNKELYRVSKANTLMNSAVSVYGKLNRAGSVMQVRGVISNAYVKLNQVRRAMNDADQTEKEQLRFVANQLRGAISRSKKKITQLQKEQQLQAQQRREIAQRQLEEAQEARRLLSKKKSARTAQEQAYLKQASIEVYLEQDRARRVAEARHKSEIYSAAPTMGTGVSSSVSASTAAPSAPSGAMVVQASTVSISFA